MKRITECFMIALFSTFFAFTFPEIGSTLYNIAIEAPKSRSKPRIQKKPTKTLWAGSSLLEGISGLVWGAQIETDQTKAVIHHTDSPCWTTVEDINRWHKERGWDGVGYHYIIYCDGSVVIGRNPYKKGAHAKGRNRYLGIALVGHDNFTDNQLNSLNNLIRALGIKHIEPHHEECPGKGVHFEHKRIYPLVKRGNGAH